MELSYHEKLEALDDDEVYEYLTGEEIMENDAPKAAFTNKPGETPLCPECSSDWLNYDFNRGDPVWECPGCGEEFSTQDLIDIAVLPPDTGIE